MQKAPFLNPRFYLIVLSFFVVTFLFTSCKKDSGPGGTSTIKGKVWVKNYNSDFSILIGEYWAEEEDVYIMYGSDSIYSDRFKTNYDGSYWFQFLREGEYTIYAYSKDDLTPPLSESYRKPVKVSVTISDNGQVIDAPLITILN